MRLEHFLKETATRHPKKLAVVSGARRLSFGDIDEMSDRLAGTLAARGIGRGDSVPVFMESSWESVVAVFAILKAGAAVSPIDPATAADELAAILRTSRAAAIITGSRLARTTGTALTGASQVRLVVLAGAGDAPVAAGCLGFEEAISSGAPAPVASIDASDLDPAILTYAADLIVPGRAVAVTHRSAVAAAKAFATCLEGSADEIVLSVLPLSFEHGLYQVLAAIKVGATLVVEKSHAAPSPAARWRSEGKGPVTYPRLRDRTGGIGSGRRDPARAAS